MTDFLIDYTSLLVRWLHVVAGIAWVGASFYFVWLDSSLERPTPELASEGVAGHLWAVHGGGFYHNHKFLVAPREMPQHLHWFKWEAYWTWISGFALLCLVYYAHPETYLQKPGMLTGSQAIFASVGLLLGGYLVYELLCESPLGRSDGLLLALGLPLIAAYAALSTHLFTGRGAFIQVGATLGTIMAANVVRVIIPGQRKLVAALGAGRTPDPEPGRRGKQRSVHNSYLTLPVVFLMISNHYGNTYGDARAWLVLMGFTVSGIAIRHFSIRRHQGSLRPAMLVIASLVLLATGAYLGRDTLDTTAPASAAPGPALGAAGALALVGLRCGRCHATASPAGGIALKTLADLDSHAAIARQAVSSGRMPLGNATQMTATERARLVAWLGTAGG
jgi:uncharacterized membrane protein